MRSLSQQYPVSPGVFAMAAGMAGLFPINFKGTKTYPKRGNYCQIMCQHLVKRPFKIRLAEKSDLKDLVHLEALTWEKHMQQPERVLKKRLTTSPTTCLVATVDGNLAAVLYMQKIENLSSVDRQKLQYVHETHDPEGSVIQLISINVNPKYASMAIGSDLRAFALHLAHLDSSINSVCAVTRCRDFKGYLGSLETYVNNHVDGRLVDPILDFHTSFGARVLKLVEGFRPEDTDNNGTGVLIQYLVNDLMAPSENTIVVPETKSDADNGERNLPTFNIVKSLMKEWGYEVDDDDPYRGFFDYGMDSLEIQSVRNKLSEIAGYELPVSTMLDYPSVISLSNHLDSIRGNLKNEDPKDEDRKDLPTFERLRSVQEEQEPDIDMESVPSSISEQAPKTMQAAEMHGLRLARNASMLAHGWTCGPMLLQFVATFLGPLRKMQEGATASELATHTRVAVGPLSLILRTCAILEYLEFDRESGKYRVVPGPELDELEKYLNPRDATAETLDSIYEEAVPPFRMDSQRAAYILGVWEGARPLWSTSTSKGLKLLLDGIVLTPLLTSITYYGFWKGEGFQYGRINSVSKQTLASIFEEVGVGSMNAQGNLTMTASGSAALKRCYSYFVPTSYTPLLSRFNHILLKDPGWGFTGTAQELSETPIHVQNLWSVVNNGAPHLSLFKDMMSHISILFNNEDFSSQPAFIADCGSGDGYFLMYIYDFIKTKTLRARALSKYPLVMVGVGYDEEAKTMLKLHLGQNGIPNQVIVGNLGNPAGIISAFKQVGIDPRKVLHVRAFADHDRPYMRPAHIFSEDSASAAFVRASFADITHLDKKGRVVDGPELFCSFLEHFSRWSSALEGSFGLCMLEEMMIDVPTTKKFLNDNVSFHFDIIQCLSRHHTISPTAFALGLSMAGLFPSNFKASRAYPDSGPYCRIVNQHLTKRPFKIRLAEQSDISRLLALEALAWEKHMQASKEVLLRRLTTSPTTNLVCTINGYVVGVLYMQRIPSLDAIERQKFMRISDSHDPDGRIMQLIAINVDPEYKTMGIGSELRAFALYLARVDASISSVCAVTLCRDYKNFKGSMQAYVDQHVAGLLHDPIVGFHTGFGAVVQCLVPNYRPEDTDNRGTGVLIEYFISDMWKHVSGSRRNSTNHMEKVQAMPTLQVLKPILSKVGFEVNDDNMDLGFFGDSGFGMDSLDSVSVLHELSSKLGMELQTTLMFDYPSSRSICDYLDRVRMVNTSSVLNLPRSIEVGFGFVRQASVDSRYSTDSGRPALHDSRRPSSDVSSKRSGPLGKLRNWEKMSVRELMEMQHEIRQVLEQPRYQERFSDIARKCYPDFMKYTMEIEPILCEVEGPVMLQHGYIEDDSFEVVQKSRPLLFRKVFLKYCKTNPEVKRLGAELVRLTGQDQNWPSAWTGTMHEAAQWLSRMVSRKSQVGLN